MLVARVAAGAEHDRVGEVGGRRREFGREHRSRKIGRERAVGAEVAGQEDDIVPAAEQRRAELRRGPRLRVLRRTMPFAVISVCGATPVPDCSSVVIGARGVGEEVITCHERGRRRDRLRPAATYRRRSARRSRRASRRSNRPRQPRHRELDARIEIASSPRRRPGSARSPGCKARVGDRRARNRRFVSRFLTDERLVGIAEERNRTVVADDDDILQAPRCWPRYESTIVLISSATRFVAYGQSRMRRRLGLERADAADPRFTSTMAPAISERAANACSLLQQRHARHRAC